MYKKTETKKIDSKFICFCILRKFKINWTDKILNLEGTERMTELNIYKVAVTWICVPFFYGFCETIIDIIKYSAISVCKTIWLNQYKLA